MYIIGLMAASMFFGLAFRGGKCIYREEREFHGRAAAAYLAIDDGVSFAIASVFAILAIPLVLLIRIIVRYWMPMTIGAIAGYVVMELLR